MTNIYANIPINETIYQINQTVETNKVHIKQITDAQKKMLILFIFCRIT